MEKKPIHKECPSNYAAINTITKGMSKKFNLPKEKVKELVIAAHSNDQWALVRKPHTGLVTRNCDLSLIKTYKAYSIELSYIALRQFIKDNK